MTEKDYLWQAGADCRIILKWTVKKRERFRLHLTEPGQGWEVGCYDNDDEPSSYIQYKGLLEHVRN
jgi:hypothetical protein